MRLFYKLSQSTFRIFFRFFYHHKVYGLEQLPTGAALIAANHTSFLDPPLIGASCQEEVFYFARASLFKNPLFGYFIARLNAYPVKGDGADLATFKAIASFLEKQRKVLIFPEGVRSADGQLTDFKQGAAMLAFRANCPVIPVYVHGTYEIWSRYNKFPKFKGNSACVFGKPIYPDAFKHLDKKEAQEELTKQIKDSIDHLRSSYEAGDFK